MSVMSVAEAEVRLAYLVHRASQRRERTVITDHGRPAAVLISPQELEDLEDDLAIAQYELSKAAGTLRTVPHHVVRTRLGLNPT